MFTQLALCIAIILVFVFTKNDAKRKKYVLPLMFIIVAVFFAIRYEYGNDYWHYYERWESGRKVEGDERGTGEILFYGFMGLFDKYYKYVIAQTLAFCLCMFFLVRKYVKPSYYFIFFWLFMTSPTQSYAMMSAQRSTMAACVLWIALDFFYITKKRWIPYMLMVVVASLYHTSALIMAVIPLFDLVLKNIKPQILFILLIIGLIVSMSYTDKLVEYLLSQSAILQDAYSGYLDTNRVGNASINGTLVRSILLFPYYFIGMNKSYYTQDEKAGRIWILAMTIALFWSYGLDIDGRFSIYLFVFVIICFANIMKKLTKEEKIWCLVPLLVYWLFVDVYTFYIINVKYQFTDANYGDGSCLFYHTIFSAPVLP